MKNRRLNILLIAIIALAAAPQALQDAHRLVNAAHERFETEFWNVFLSYQIPAEASGAESNGANQLMAARQPESKGSCPLQREAAQPVEVASDAQSTPASAQVRAKAEARRASAKADTGDTQSVEPAIDDQEAVASTESARDFEFSEKEQKVLKIGGLHARDTEKLDDAATRATMASFVQGNEKLQIKVRQLMEMDKLMRPRNREMRERIESTDEESVPIGSM